LTEALLEHPNPYKPLLPLLHQSSNPEDPIPLLASTFLASLLSYALSNPSKQSSDIDSALSKLYTYLSSLAKSTDSGFQDIAVQAYSSLLRMKQSRELFWQQKSETVEPLVDILRAAIGLGKDGDSSSTLWSGGTSIRNPTDAVLSGGVGLQLLYHVLLVLWQLSFEGAMVGDGLEESVFFFPTSTSIPFS
jgi:V-type H+-transporting ATPase subunit H